MMTTIVADRLRPGIRDFGARVLETVTASHARVGAFLLAMSLVCFLPGFFNIAPIDRDEPRFAQATKQMIESGDYVDIRFQDEVRYKKPVGIYWLQAAAVHDDLALSHPVAGRRARRRAAHLLDRARLRVSPQRLPRRADARRLDH